MSILGLDQKYSLTLADLLAHDLTPSGTDPERRFICPFPDCAHHTNGRRDLSANLDTGVYHCWSCGAAGKMVGTGPGRPGPRRPPVRWPGPKIPKPPKAPKPRNVGPVRRWRCQSVSGAVVATHCRQDQAHADGTTGKVIWWEPSGVKPVDLLYWPISPDTLPADAVLVPCEGEKAADAAQRLLPEGYYAVGIVCGASSTPSEDVLDLLARYRVILWPDADAPGQRIMRRVAERLLERGSAVRWLVIPDAQNHDDAANYRGTAAELGDLLDHAPGVYGVLGTVSADESEQLRAQLTACETRAKARVQAAWATTRAWQDRCSSYLQVIGNNALQGAAPRVGLVSVRDYARALDQDRLDERGRLRLNMHRLGEAAGCSHTTALRHLQRLAPAGFELEAETEELPDRTTGEIRPLTVYHLRLPTVLDEDEGERGQLARLARPSLQLVPEEKRHGGKRTCKRHGCALEQRRVCPECETERDRIVLAWHAEHGPMAPPVHDEPHVPPVHDEPHVPASRRGRLVPLYPPPTVHLEPLVNYVAHDESTPPVHDEQHLRTCAVCSFPLNAGERYRCTMCQARHGEQRLYVMAGGATPVHDEPHVPPLPPAVIWTNILTPDPAPDPLLTSVHDEPHVPEPESDDARIVRLLLAWGERHDAERQTAAPVPNLEIISELPPTSPVRRCFACGSARWWTRPDGSEDVCGVCHPPLGRERP